MVCRRYPKPTFDGIPSYRIANGFGHSEAETTMTIRRGCSLRNIAAYQIVRDDVRIRDPAAAFQHRDEFTVAPQPLHAVPRCWNQAERDLRPLARRRLMTARPERVRIRRRKPCFM